MTAEQLVGMLESWSDALNLMEVVGSPFLRVTSRWDLHDWQASDVPDGILFQRRDGAGDVIAEVMVNYAYERRRRLGPARLSAAVPTWMIEVGPEQIAAREEVQPVI
jgi:hypothetical protein